MSPYVRQVIEELEALPLEKQEAYAAFLHEEIKSDEIWDALFAKSHDMLGEMAAEAIAEYKAGRTTPLEDIVG